MHLNFLMIPIMLKQYKNKSGREGKLKKISNYYFLFGKKLIETHPQDKKKKKCDTSLKEKHFYQFYHVWDEFSKENKMVPLTLLF